MHMKPLVRTRAILAILALAGLAAVLVTACEDSEAPLLPTRITIESGDEQWSRRGTALPEPLRVRVRFEDGSLAAGFPVDFSVGGVGGTLSPRTVETNVYGIAATRLTLPDQLGTAIVRAAILDSPESSVEFTAVSSEFYCPEEDPTFTQKFTSSDPLFNELFLFTRESGLFGGAGIIRITPGPAQGVFSARTMRAFDEEITRKVVRDASFSASGDYFLAWSFFRDEVVEVNPDFSTAEGGFSGLASIYGTEITATPAGVLVGCDEFGPFYVGCRDTLGRFEDATLPGVDANDYASGDAVCVDPATDDIYYIDVTGAMLMRLPMTGLVPDGAPEAVAALTADEAGASGMEFDGDDSTIYLLVDTQDTRAIVAVTSTGARTTEVDFLTNPETSASPGRQNDLAIDRELRFLYTVDRLNNTLLLWNIGQQQLTVMEPNPADTDPEALSTDGVADERLGLVVIPSAGL